MTTKPENELNELKILMTGLSKDVKHLQETVDLKLDQVIKAQSDLELRVKALEINKADKESLKSLHAEVEKKQDAKAIAPLLDGVKGIVVALVLFALGAGGGMIAGQKRAETAQHYSAPAQGAQGQIRAY